MPLLERLGEQNLREIGETIAKHDIDCDFQLTGELNVATAAWQLDGIEEQAAAARALGHQVEILDAAAVRRELNSPILVGGLKVTTGNALLEPGRLAWGLRRACLDAGVRIYEQTPVGSITADAAGLTLTTPYGSVRAGRVVLGGRGVRPLAAAPDRRLRDTGLGLRADDRAAVGRAAGRLGWHGPRGASDMSNQFHYFRLTRDNRMLWGGYDAVYYNGGRIRDEHAYSPATFGKLAEQFFTAFPQLEGLSFSHAWGGIIDTCSRFCAFFGTAYGGRLGYVAGYTGLGVGATRFGAQVLLDKIENRDSERTRLALVRSKPLPFPPEPVRSGVIQLTRASIARADENEGRRDAWLRLLDRVGLGFDS
jgi:glycine/D-amino acid oxidase-like deaminating enzyme